MTPVDSSLPGSSMGLFRQEEWSGLLYPSPGDLPNPVIKPECPASPALQMDYLPLSQKGSPSPALRVTIWDQPTHHKRAKAMPLPQQQGRQKMRRSWGRVGYQPSRQASIWHTEDTVPYSGQNSCKSPSLVKKESLGRDFSQWRYVKKVN